MAVLNLAALGAVLKQKYNQRKFNMLGYNKNPFYAMLNKSTDFDGDNKVVAMRIGATQGRSHTFSSAQANLQPSTYKRFTVTRARDYSIFRITTEAIRASKGETGSLIKGLQKEVESAIFTATRNIAQELYRNGGSARGQGTSLASTVLTLSQAADVAQFEVGMTIVASTSDGSSGGVVKPGSVQIVGVDRDAGTLTANTNWTTGITGFAATDFLFQDGDFGSGLKGLQAWLPQTAPVVNDSFFGVDRSADATRMAGVRVSGSGGPIEETLIETAARLAREGSSPDVCFMNPLDESNLVKALSGKSIYDRAGQRMSSNEPDVGFKSIQLMTPVGMLDVVADVNCPKGRAFMLQMDTWSFETAGPGPAIFDDDGFTLIRNPTSDDYEGRVGYFGQLICEAPGWNAQITL